MTIAIRQAWYDAHSLARRMRTREAVRSSRTIEAECSLMLKGMGVERWHAEILAHGAAESEFMSRGLASRILWLEMIGECRARGLKRECRVMLAKVQRDMSTFWANLPKH